MREIRAAAAGGHARRERERVGCASIARAGVACPLREAAITFTDLKGAQVTKWFLVVDSLCRDKPLHPAFVLANRDDHTTVKHPPSARFEMFSPQTASAYSTDGIATEVRANGPGHGTLMVATTGGEISLWDVFVGETCADEHYVSTEPVIPDGFLGPKGDGTCVMRGEKIETPWPCPDSKKAPSLPIAEFSRLACDWAAACDVRGYEGCCVECTRPFPMKIERSCAQKALERKTCADVQKVLQVPGCIK